MRKEGGEGAASWLAMAVARLSCRPLCERVALGAGEYRAILPGVSRGPLVLAVG